MKIFINHLREHKEYIMASYLLGRSTVELSNETGINSGQISRFLREECGVKMRSKSKLTPLIFPILDLRKKGFSKYRIAKQLNISEKSVSKIV